MLQIPAEALSSTLPRGMTLTPSPEGFTPKIPPPSCPPRAVNAMDDSNDVKRVLSSEAGLLLLRARPQVRCCGWIDTNGSKCASSRAGMAPR